MTIAPKYMGPSCVRIIVHKPKTSPLRIQVTTGPHNYISDQGALFSSSLTEAAKMTATILFSSLAVLCIIVSMESFQLLIKHRKYNIT